MATFIIDELVRNASLHSNLLDTYDFYILPLVNPDGYRHSCGLNRFWRKSRKRFNFLTGMQMNKLYLKGEKVVFR